MQQKYLRFLVVMLSLVLLSLVGCTQGSQDQVLVVAQGVDATMLDPGMHTETTTANVERQIFDSLIEKDKDLEFQPALATSWQAISDTVWEIELRTGVEFHDGVEFTAADVKYTIERILDPAKNSPQAPNFNAISSVEVKGTHLLHIHTLEPYPIMPARLAGLRIVPQHYVEEVGDNRFKVEPIGTGAYTFVKWDKDDQVVLAANPNYWRGEPAIKDVVFKAIPEAASRVMALQAGQVDIAVNIPPHQIDEVNNSKRGAIAEVPSTRFLLTQFIMTPGTPLADKNVRLAINLAVDVESIIANLLDGSGTPLEQTLSELDFGYNPALSAYGYDPDRAKELLAAAGYPDGFKLSFAAPTGRYMMDKEVAEAVASQLQAVGLEVELKLPEWGVYVEQIMSRKVDADMWLIGWGNSLLDAEGTLYTWFHTGQRFYYYDVEPARTAIVDGLLDRARANLNVDQRASDYQQALAMIHEDVPWLLLHQQKDLYGVSKRVEWTPRSDEAILLYDASWK